MTIRQADNSQLTNRMRSRDWRLRDAEVIWRCPQPSSDLLLQIHGRRNTLTPVIPAPALPVEG